MKRLEKSTIWANTIANKVFENYEFMILKEYDSTNSENYSKAGFTKKVEKILYKILEDTED